MERIIKKVYNTFYQQSAGVSYKEQVIVTVTTIVFLLAITIQFFNMMLSDF